MKYKSKRSSVPPRTRQSMNNNTHGTSATTTASTITPIACTSDEKQTEFVQAIQEVDKILFRVAWKEIVVILGGLIALSVGSVILAMAAEVSISVHYFDRYSPRSFAALDARERQLNFHHRVTIMEPDVISVNTGQQQHNRDRARLERVIYKTSSGHHRTMPIVQESPLEGTETQSARTVLQATPPVTNYEELASVRPKLCSDHYTVGFDDWDTLKRAFQEANTLSVERFVQWSRFFADIGDSFTGTFDDDSLYYEEDILLTICPGTTLRARKGPIHVNAPNIILECKDCNIEVGGTHMAFGPHAKNVVIRGITFKNAKTSSLVFYKNGANVAFEDCAWHDNSAISGRYGAVADVNSTSVVNFYRCFIGKTQRGEVPGMQSSLSVRT